MKDVTKHETGLTFGQLIERGIRKDEFVLVIVHGGRMASPTMDRLTKIIGRLSAGDKLPKALILELSGCEITIDVYKSATGTEEFTNGPNVNPTDKEHDEHLPDTEQDRS